MKLLIYRKLVLQSSLDRQDLIAGLAEYVEPYNGFRFDNYRKSSKLFVGKMREHSFDIRPVFKGRNSFVPYIHGSARTLKNESEIVITMRLHYGVLIMLLVFFAVLPLFRVFQYHEMTGLGIIVLMYALTVYFFNDECNKAKHTLQAILEAHAETTEDDTVY